VQPSGAGFAQLVLKTSENALFHTVLSAYEVGRDQPYLPGTNQINTCEKVITLGNSLPKEGGGRYVSA
jgi:hypothetical protein